MRMEWLYAVSAYTEGPDDVTVGASGVIETEIAARVAGTRHVDVMVFWMPIFYRAYYDQQLTAAANAVEAAIEDCRLRIPNSYGNSAAQDSMKTCVEGEVSLTAIIVVDARNVGFCDSPGEIISVHIEHNSYWWRLVALAEV